MKQPSTISGYINIGENKYAFILENYRGKIFNNAPNVFWPREVDVPKIIYGVTDKNYNIALCISHPRESGNCIVFSCPYYIMDKANCFNYDISEFKEIEFVGESLNLIIDPTEIYEIFNPEEDMFETGCSINFKPLKSIAKKFNFKIMNTDIEFEHTIIPYEKRKGNKLGETNSAIYIKFHQTQKIEELEKWYIFIKKLTSLLVLQHNIDFDSINIFYDVPLENGTSMRHYAKVFVNQTYDNLVSKSPIRCIELKLFDENMQELLSSLENDKFSLMFLPDSNDDAHIVNYDIVRNICTALEFEYKKNKSKLAKNSLIVELQDLVRNEIKKFKDSHSELDKDDYASIEGSISYWTIPAKKQVWCLYENNIDIMQFICDKKGVYLSYQQVCDFIKFRNDITHGKFPHFTQEIADTAYVLKILIYVSLLKRIGLNDEVIKDRLIYVF